MSRWKIVFAGVVLASLAIFIVQNREILELRFLFFEFQTRRAYMLIAIFLAGLALGGILATISQLTARSREADERAHPHPEPGTHEPATRHTRDEPR